MQASHHEHETESVYSQWDIWQHDTQSNMQFMASVQFFFWERRDAFLEYSVLIKPR